jgi:hypothetical protein
MLWRALAIAPAAPTALALSARLVPRREQQLARSRV